jgi:hypothetical protein
MATDAPVVVWEPLTTLHITGQLKPVQGDPPPAGAAMGDTVRSGAVVNVTGYVIVSTWLFGVPTTALLGPVISYEPSVYDREHVCGAPLQVNDPATVIAVST